MNKDKKFSNRQNEDNVTVMSSIKDIRPTHANKQVGQISRKTCWFI